MPDLEGVLVTPLYQILIQFVTTQSWNPAVDAPVDGYGSQFIGDYQGLAVDNRFVHPFWNDTRTGAQEIFTTAVPSALQKRRSTT
jgi:hypothetical protein